MGTVTPIRKNIDIIPTPEVFIAYAHGLCFMSICTSITDIDELVALANTKYETGITSDWRLADKSFITGEPNPCPCNDNPDTHKHYLLSC